MIAKISESWRRHLDQEFSSEYFLNLADFVKSEYKSKGLKIYPPLRDVFRAFDLCPFNDSKVVIIGQDPYHGKGQANGLCFAVGEGVKLPPSLVNIFKEIKSDLGVDPYVSGDLSRWAEQGVLLLNSTLTVRDSSPGSHQGRGWEEFTSAAIRALSTEREHLVFLLWGNYAKRKGAIIDRAKHLVLESAHPSPFSVYNGFMGNRHFSQTNRYLFEQGITEIDWR